MAHNNEVKLIGNVGSDPKDRTTKSGKLVTNFPIAVDTHKAGEDEQVTKNEPMWVTIVTWEKLAQTVAKTIKKGNLVKVIGRLRLRTYVDKKGGEKEAVEVVAESVTPLKKQDHPEEENVA